MGGRENNARPGEPIIQMKGSRHEPVCSFMSTPPSPLLLRHRRAMYCNIPLRDVVNPTAHIIYWPSLHLLPSLSQSSNALSLTCVVHQPLTPPSLSLVVRATSLDYGSVVYRQFVNTTLTLFHDTSTLLHEIASNKLWGIWYFLLVMPFLHVKV